MYSQYQVTDCGWRPPKRPVRVGANAESDTCEYQGRAFNPATNSGTSPPSLVAEYQHNALCSDFSDDLLHSQDLRVVWGGSADARDEQCGRGTQTYTCREVAGTTAALRLDEGTIFGTQGGLANTRDVNVVETKEDTKGSLAYNNHRYHEKATYINPNLAGHGACVSPFNMLHNSDGHLVRPRMYHDTRAEGSSLVDEYTVWFDKGVGTPGGDTLRDNMRLWTKEVCSDGGEGSVRVPMQFDVSYIEEGQAAGTDTKFFYDFACPYGSQPEACGDYPREGLKEYQETMDELAQPSGPAFPNCFDDDVPDFECCHATQEFRIHGGPGMVGNTGVDDPAHCALTEPGTNPNLPNLHTYSAKGKGTMHQMTSCSGCCCHIVRPSDPVGSWAHYPYLLTLPSDTIPLDWGGQYVNMTSTSCKALCDDVAGGGFYDYVPGQAPASYAMDSGAQQVQCNSFTILGSLCYLYKETDAEYTAVTLGADEHSQSFSKLPDTEYTWDEVTDTLGDCPLHYTSYHHTSTGCKAFCQAAFQRDGDDDTCMPSKPECANWLDSDDFPTGYVTVNAECICGAKLEELQDSGKYVHTGTVLQGTRDRARRVLHEDAAKDNDRWSWPDPVMAGIDQFHGNHFDAGDACVAEIMSFRTDLLNNSRCDNYLSMGAPPIDEWDETNPNGHEMCADDGSNDDACCVVHRGEAQASRLWMQRGDMSTASVASAFSRSSVVGTAVHTSRVAAVGNFVRLFATFKP